jgi:hypothetical protein
MEYCVTLRLAEIPVAIPFQLRKGIGRSVANLSSDLPDAEPLVCQLTLPAASMTLEPPLICLKKIGFVLQKMRFGTRSREPLNQGV